MRRAVLAALILLAACAAPSGDERRGCGAEWIDAESVVATARGINERAIAIECIEQIANRRLSIGFTLPGGPDCYLLRRVELVESADAISITLFAAVDDDPNVGACSDEPRAAVTELDLASPVDQRQRLDGSAVADDPSDPVKFSPSES